MPIKSKSQWRWMFENDPEMAKEWAEKTKTKYKDLPEKVESEDDFIDELNDKLTTINPYSGIQAPKANDSMTSGGAPLPTSTISQDKLPSGDAGTGLYHSSGEKKMKVKLSTLEIRLLRKAFQKLAEVMEAPVKEPETTPFEAPTTEPEEHPQPTKKPFTRPAVLPQEKNLYLKKTAEFDENVDSDVSKFWEEIPEEHPYRNHPILSTKGKELSEQAYKYTKEKPKSMHHGEAIQRIISIEKGHKEQLEALAKTIALQIFDIDPDLIQPELGPPEKKQDTNKSEVVKKLSDLSPEELGGVHKRITLNALTQGSAVHLFLSAHHMIEEAIKQISPELMDLYSSFASGSLEEYWLNDFTKLISQMGAASGSIGNEFIDWPEGQEQPRIVAQGLLFPVLVQEIIKGIMELLTMDGLKDYDEQELLTIYEYADRHVDEPWLIQVGPELWRKFLKIIDGLDDSLQNIIRKLSSQSPEVVHDIVLQLVENPETAKELLASIE